MNIADPRLSPDLVPQGSIARIINDADKTYQDLPSVVTPGGQVITRWTFTDAERKAILMGEDLYITILSYGPINPLSVTVGPVNWNPTCESCIQILEFLNRGLLTAAACLSCGQLWKQR